MDLGSIGALYATAITTGVLVGLAYKVLDWLK